MVQYIAYTILIITDSSAFQATYSVQRWATKGVLTTQNNDTSSSKNKRVTLAPAEIRFCWSTNSDY
uniref:Uncharacterized protein n=1 Tax=Arundo donax TaxID=35708 RepID=A0A0A9DSB6_ARUDO